MTDMAHNSTAESVLTLDDFLHGHRERILRATKPRILVMWQHGNEELGPRFGYFMHAKRPDLFEYVDYLCGNPEVARHQLSAGEAGIDLNRSYHPERAPLTAIEHRAQEILTLIRERGYEYVIDLHTSVTEKDRFIIIQNDTADVRAMVAATPITRVIHIPTNLVGNAMLAHVPKAVVLEYGEAFAETNRALDEVLSTVEVLLGMRKPTPMPREIYHVDRLIPKTEDPGLDAENFKMCRDGYYPALFGTGRASYRNDPNKTYLGFGARRKEEITL